MKETCAQIADFEGMRAVMPIRRRVRDRVMEPVDVSCGAHGWFDMI